MVPAAAILMIACAPNEEQPTGLDEAAAITDPSESPDVGLPAQAMSLAEIVAAIERQGYGPVAEAELKDDGWQLGAYKDGQRVTILADFETGGIVADRPPEGGKPLSEILRSLEGRGYGPFLDAELDADGWEIEAQKGSMAVVVVVDPASGEITDEQ
jgi:hypothetical protein